MDMLGLDETMNKVAKPDEVRWYGHVLKKMVMFYGRHWNYRLKKGRKTIDDVENTDGKKIGKVGLKQEVAPNRTKWQKGEKKMAVRCAATTIHGEILHQKDACSSRMQMANSKLNNSSYTQAKTILSHYKINFQGVNTDP